MSIPQHEPDDIATGWVAAFLAAVCASLGVMGIGLAWMFGAFERRAETSEEPASPFSALRGPPPEPRLQVSPRRDLEALRSREEAALNTWSRKDRDSPYVQVPLERALEAVTASGLPRWPRVEQPDPHTQDGERP
jgi:hypothetical protein